MTGTRSVIVKPPASGDAGAGSERTSRTRTLAARSALVLAERLYQDFVVVKQTMVEVKVRSLEKGLKKSDKIGLTTRSVAERVDETVNEQP